MADGDSSHEELRSLIGAFALGAIDPTEAADLQAHLATCASCRADLDDALVVTGYLHAARAGPVGEGRFRRRTTALVGAAVVALLALGVAGVGQRRHARRVEDRLAVAEARLASLESRVDDGARLVRMAGAGHHVDVVISATGRTAVWGADLEVLPEDQHYHLWADLGGRRTHVADLGRAVTVESFTVDPRGSRWLVTVSPTTGARPDDPVVVSS
jgi:hypothetical protein